MKEKVALTNHRYTCGSVCAHGLGSPRGKGPRRPGAPRRHRCGGSGRCLAPWELGTWVSGSSRPQHLTLNLPPTMGPQVRTPAGPRSGGTFYLQHQSPGALRLSLQRPLARAHACAQAQAALLSSSPADSSKPPSSPITFSQAKFGNISLGSRGWLGNTPKMC